MFHGDFGILIDLSRGCIFLLLDISKVSISKWR